MFIWINKYFEKMFNLINVLRIEGGREILAEPAKPVKG